MNRKGQSLIVFVLLLPVIVFFLALFIDSSLMFLEHNRLSSTIKDNMKIILDKNILDEEKIKAIILENDKSLNVNVTIDNKIKIDVTGKKKNIFGNILKLKWYNEKYCFLGNYDTKLVTECK